MADISTASDRRAPGGKVHTTACRFFPSAHASRIMLHSEIRLDEQVSTAIKGNPYLQSRKLRFETSGGNVRLHGQVTSWYQKQMAQEMLMRMEGIEQVENHLEVCWA